MILIDTSIWIDHLRSNDPTVVALLLNGSVLAHPWIIGEVAMGDYRHRGRILTRLEALNQAKIASTDEVLLFIETHRLYGTGIGFVDAALLASAKLTPSCFLWTRDRRLHAAAERLGLAAEAMR